VRFRIEHRWLSTTRPAVVFARALEPGNFALGPQPTLGGVRIRRTVTQPRARRPNGLPDLEIFCFTLELRADIALLELGAEVELASDSRPGQMGRSTLSLPAFLVCEHDDVLVEYDHPHGVIPDVAVRDLQASPTQSTRPIMCLRNARCASCGFPLAIRSLELRTAPGGDLHDPRFRWVE
jgi:hypothetical protein